MFKAIIVGWNYSRERIPAWIDIISVHQWLRPFTADIVIISDETERLQHLLSLPPLTSSVTSSLSHCEMTCQKTTLHQVSTKQELLRVFYKERNNRCIFYYTGHGIEDNMVLPSDEIIAWNDIYRLLKYRAKELTMIIDCCSAPSFGLPYSYSNGWKGREEESRTRVTLFTPRFEKSIVETDGSVFTQNFISSHGKGYDKLTVGNVNISSNNPHPPLFHPLYRYYYRGENLCIQTRRPPDSSR